MTQIRIEQALTSGMIDASGAVVLFGAKVGDDLSMLPAERLLVVSTLKTVHTAFAARGIAVAVAAPEACDLAIVLLPRAKALARGMIAQAARMTRGQVVVDGQKTDGIDSVLKDLRGRVDLAPSLSKGHGKLSWFKAAAGLADWSLPETPVEVAQGFVTVPGVFSADGIDPASALLAATLPDGLGARVADLGAGWGYLGREVLRRESVKFLELVEVDHAALECARRNIDDPRARFHWADATTWKAAAKLDAVVMNPPFHSGRAADPELGRAFIATAAANLAPSGKLWMVANRHLPYEAALTQLFAEVTEVAGDNRFKILCATRPKVAGPRHTR